jgi:hypothetical protein
LFVSVSRFPLAPIAFLLSRRNLQVQACRCAGPQVCRSASLQILVICLSSCTRFLLCLFSFFLRQVHKVNGPGGGQKRANNEAEQRGVLLRSARIRCSDRVRQGFAAMLRFFLLLVVVIGELIWGICSSYRQSETSGLQGSSVGGVGVFILFTPCSVLSTPRSRCRIE